jgi:hypothetical protein
VNRDGIEFYNKLINATIAKGLNLLPLPIYIYNLVVSHPCCLILQNSLLRNSFPSEKEEQNFI